MSTLCCCSHTPSQCHSTPAQQFHWSSLHISIQRSSLWGFHCRRLQGWPGFDQHEKRTVGRMILCIEFQMSWVVSFVAVSCTSSGGQTACWLWLITLAGRRKGRVVLSPWLAEEVGGETTVRITTIARNSILQLCFIFLCQRFG